MAWTTAHSPHKVQPRSNDPIVGDVCAHGDVMEWKHHEHCQSTKVGILVQDHPYANAEKGGKMWLGSVPANLAALCARYSLPPLEAGGMDVTDGSLAMAYGNGVARQ